MFHNVLPTVSNTIAAPLRRFRRDEDGLFMPFVVSVFLVLLLIGGFAVDLMRYENVRTKLQNTTDRAVLAATKLTQEQDPEEVVRDYFTKADLIQYVEDINVDPGLNYRIVDATAKAKMPAIFSQMVGIPEYTVPAFSVAEQRITDLEIMLVLDVSGSMVRDSDGTPNDKLVKLKLAAKDFVTKILESDEEQRISISIVPYNAQVNLGNHLLNKFNVLHKHGITTSNCIEFTDAQYDALAVPTSTPLLQQAHADVSNGAGASSNRSANTYTSHTSGSATNASNFCRTESGNFVTLPSNSITDLHNRIDALQGNGNTSIAIGMKWAVALLDPGARSLYTSLIADNKMAAAFAGRPFDYKLDNKMKFIVLMTDGDHVEHDRIKDAYKSGLSPIYRGADGQFAIRHQTGRPTLAGTNQYWIPHLATGSNCTSSTTSNVTTCMTAGWKSTPSWTGSGTVRQLDWKEVWPVVRMKWVAWQLYGRALGGTSGSSRLSNYDTWVSNFAAGYATDTKLDTLLQKSCTLAKAQEVTVFTIAFEAPSQGTTQLDQCATDADGNQDYFFDVEDDEIESAFRTIANRISQLRLTQ